MLLDGAGSCSVHPKPLFQHAMMCSVVISDSSSPIRSDVGNGEAGASLGNQVAKARGSRGQALLRATVLGASHGVPGAARPSLHPCGSSGDLSTF